jgi:hypothetical protein
MKTCTMLHLNTQKQKHTPSALTALVVLSCSLLLTACDRGAFANSTTPPPDKDTVSVGVAGIHHLGRGHHIGEFSIDGRSCGNAGGPEKNSGSDAMCHVPLPREWQTGIKHKVRWGVTNYTEDLQRLQKGNAGQWYEAEVELERFGALVGLEVHFYPNGVVRLVPNVYGPPDEDATPEQTPPLAEIPVTAPSWYWMGQRFAMQKHEGLTKRDDIEGLKEEQAKADAYFAFLERLWRSRGLSEGQVKEKLDKERVESEGGFSEGYATYFVRLLVRGGLSKKDAEARIEGWPKWTRDEFDQRIHQYMTQSGAKK